jgi:hypothetical protein
LPRALSTINLAHVALSPWQYFLLKAAAVPGMFAIVLLKKGQALNTSHSDIFMLLSLFSSVGSHHETVAEMNGSLGIKRFCVFFTATDNILASLFQQKSSYSRMNLPVLSQQEFLLLDNPFPLLRGIHYA